MAARGSGARAAEGAGPHAPPPEAPTWRVRGGLYVTEKVLGSPPGGLIDVFLDVEQRLRGPVMAAR